MKSNNIFKSLLGTLALSALLISCGEKQDLKMWQIVDSAQDADEDGETSVTLEVMEGELLAALPGAITNGQHAYQYTNTNSVDVFAGYVVPNRSTFQYGEPLPFTYSYPNTYYGSAATSGPTSSLYNAYNYAEDLGYPEYKAIAQIVYGLCSQRAVVNVGAWPYNDYRDLKESYPLAYESQEDVFAQILDDLDEAIATLKLQQPSTDTMKKIEGTGYGSGSYTKCLSEYQWQKWVKLANTIKLRIAMYLTKPDPTKAEAVALEVLNDEYGTLDDASGDFGGAWVSGTTQHPLFLISATTGGWCDCKMAASMENAMKRLDCPLLEKLFTLNTGQLSDIVTGTVLVSSSKDYVGIRQGVSMYPKSQGIGYYNFSEVSSSFQYERQTWATVRECEFLKAEAALRWGHWGDAGTLYEQAITTTFTHYGMSGDVAGYLANNSMIRDSYGELIDYVDYYVSGNSTAGRILITPKWDDSATDEVKLEKLMTQKWICIFPNSYEAWVDFRRTGYPRLLPVPEANKWTDSPTFPVELQLRRVPFDESDENVEGNLPEIEAALAVFGLSGENAAGMRLYFEGDPSEYPWEYDEDLTSYSYGWPIPKNF